MRASSTLSGASLFSSGASMAVGKTASARPPVAAAVPSGERWRTEQLWDDKLGRNGSCPSETLTGFTLRFYRPFLHPFAGLD